MNLRTTRKRYVLLIQVSYLMASCHIPNVLIRCCTYTDRLRFRLPTWVTLCCLIFVRVVDVINLCRNISDGVRPFMPPCSLVSLYAFTNISSYLCLPSTMFGISFIARNSFFTILLYASIFPCNCG